MKNLFFLFFVLTSFISYGQNRAIENMSEELNRLLIEHQVLLKEQKVEAAINQLETALQKQEKNLSNNRELYGKITYQLGTSYLLNQNIEKAEEYLVLTAKNQRKSIGKDHPDFVKTLDSLGDLYLQSNQPDAAEEKYLEVLQIKEKIYGKGHSEVAITVNKSIKFYAQRGQFEQAEVLLESLISDMENEENKGKEYAISLHNLARVNMVSGKLKEAKALCKEALIYKEKSFGVLHEEYANTQYLLACAAHGLGEYKDAEYLYLQSLEIWKKTANPKNPQYAIGLNNLGLLYGTIGNYDKAETIYLKSKAATLQVFGKKHPFYAGLSANLADIKSKQKEYAVAEELYREALDIWEQTVGTRHPSYLQSLTNFAIFYSETEDFLQAETLLLKSKLLTAETVGKEHQDYIWITGNLGNLYWKMNKPDQAILLYQETINLCETVYGKKHDRYIENLGKLAGVYLETGAYEKGKPLFIEYMEKRKKLLVRGSKYLSEEELSQYTDLFIASNHRNWSYIQDYPQLAEYGYDDVLFYKGYLLSSVKKMNNFLSKNNRSREDFTALNELKQTLASEYSKPLNEQSNIANLEESVSNLEKKITRNLSNTNNYNNQVSWREVQANLDKNEAAIEFIHYKTEMSSSVDVVTYAAFVLRPGMDRPKNIALFEETQLRDLLTKQEDFSAFINSIYLIDKDKSSLNKLLYQPLKKSLEGVETVYFSPSGLLHRINFSAIQLDKNITLGNTYKLVQLGSTRQLVSKKEVKDIKNEEALFYGAIQYDAQEDQTKPVSVAGLSDEPADSFFKENEIVQETPTLATDRGLASPFMFIHSDSTLRGDKWNFLKWTEVEIDAIELIFEDADIKPTIKKGYAATEASFKKLGKQTSSPRVIHLATHGFFFPDPKSVPSKIENTKEANLPIFKVSDHPMIRSGLVMAGGNHAWKTGKPQAEGQEDGILTAYEISNMNLSNTELVVLSACETGLGDIEGNEGVYGLQRAFKIAGVKYLIMSLWKIPDFQTQELMTQFYVNWLEEKMEIPVAFRAAQASLRERYQDPFLWGGFILVE